jgi:hypothetical protein
MPNRLFYSGNRLLFRALLGALCLLVMLLTFPAFPEDDYSLDYSAIALDGSQSQTTNYLVVDLLKADGISGASQESADYSVTTTTGLKEQAQTSVDDWMLY